jgi:hypothetical protein
MSVVSPKEKHKINEHKKGIVQCVVLYNIYLNDMSRGIWLDMMTIHHHQFRPRNMAETLTNKLC